MTGATYTDPTAYLELTIDDRRALLERLAPVELERLWRELDAMRASGGHVLRAARRDAWHEWRRKLIVAGRDPGATRRDSLDEVERFFAHTIPGLEGCLIWDGPPKFKRPNKGAQDPQRWARIHAGGTIPLGAVYRVVSTCGTPSCVNPDHLAVVKADRRRYSDERCIGALQALALRLGHTPTTAEWADARWKPTEEVPRKRWGSWEAFCRAAGLEPRFTANHKQPDEVIFARMRELAAKLGRAPSMKQWNDSGSRPWAQTLQGRFGGWTPLLLAAGVEPNRNARNHKTDEELRRALLDYYIEHGEVPTQRKWERLTGAPAVSTYRKRFGTFNDAVVAAGMSVRLPEHPLRKYAKGLRRGPDGALIADETIRQVERRLLEESLA